MEAAIQITEGQKLDLSVEVAKICIKLEGLASALTAKGSIPAAEALSTITKQLDNLMEPIADLQGVRS